MSSLLSHVINPDKIIAEYVWIGGSSMELRSKASTMSGPVCDPSYSTNQASGDDIEVLLYPQAIFKDPFSRGNIIAMCDTYYTPAREPNPTNMKKKKKNKNKKKKKKKKRSRTRY